MKFQLLPLHLLFFVFIIGYSPSKYLNLNTLQPNEATGLQCGDYITLSCGQTVSGSTFGKVSNYSSNDFRSCYNTNSSFAGGDQLYRITVPTNSTLTVRLTNVTNDLDLFVFTSCNPSPPCLGYSVGSNLSSETITIQNASGTYYILVDGYTSGISGNFQLQASCSTGNSCYGTPNPNIICTTIYDPVCGCNGVTYGNSCEALRAGILQYTQGACGNTGNCYGTPNYNIVCSTIYDPVCGCDGQTYSNACYAERNGILQYTRGTCGSTTTRPNLQPYSGSWTVSGCSISTSIGIQNVGSAAAGSFNVRVYLTTSSSPTNNHQGIVKVLGTFRLSSLSAGAARNIASTFSANGVPNGTYYLAYDIDYNNEVSETDESFDNNNGLFSSPKTITGCGTTLPQRCDSYIPLSCGDIVTGTTIGKSNNFNITDFQSCFSSSASFAGGDQLYRINVPTTSTLIIELTNVTADLDIFVFRSCSSNPSCIASSTDGDLSDEQITITNASGVYYILVDGYASSIVGNYRLQVRCGSTSCFGPPNPTILCNAVYDPVCGCDGRTYTNSCYAQEAGILQYTRGACGTSGCYGTPDPNAVCLAIYDPVCGCDGNTYSNSCVARALGILQYTNGECGRPTNFANLQPSSGSWGVSGCTVSTNLGIVNNGTDNAGGFNVRVYLTTSNSATSNHQGIVRVLGTFRVGDLVAGSSKNITSNFFVNNLPARVYYLGYDIDYNNEVNETDESFDNNNGIFSNAVNILGCTNLTEPTENELIGDVESGKPIIKSSSLGELTYYPNPTNGKLTVNADFENTNILQVEIVNRLGAVIQTLNVNHLTQFSHQFDLSNQTPGLYYLKLKTDKEVIVKPIVLTK